VLVWVSVRAGSVDVKETVSEYVEMTVLAGSVISLVEVSTRVRVPAGSDVVTVYGYEVVIVDAGKTEVVVICRTVVCVSGGKVLVCVCVRAGKVEVREIVSEYVEMTVLAGSVISLVEVSTRVRVPAGNDVVKVYG
jgi:3-polyprenyl-4-hydroxybenzoate decarboxylase